MSNILTTDWANTIRVMEEYGERVKEQYRANLEMNRHNATGNLSNNIEVVIINEPDRLEVALNLEHYWKWVENGRAAGKMPPVKAIEDWIVAKKIVPQVNDVGKVPTIQQLSWAIAKTIEKKGYQPVGHPFQNAVDSLIQEFEAALNNAIMMDLDVDINKAISYLEF